jgi:hypothetical protein
MAGAAWAQTQADLPSAAQPARIQVEHARGVAELPWLPGAWWCTTWLRWTPCRRSSCR